MAVFTAAATAIVAAATGSTFAAVAGAAAFSGLALSVKAVSFGLALATAKISGIASRPDVRGGSQGVKVQLPPATDNKVPKLYGRNIASGPFIDAEIKNQNKTMTYCMVLSEYTAGETWRVGRIRRGDQTLVFGNVDNNEIFGNADTMTVRSVVDPNSTTNINLDSKIRVRVYAGGSTGDHQIFPTNNDGTLPAATKANAWAEPNQDGFGQFRNWTAANTMTDLVFAIIEIDYDAENDLLGIGNWNFELTNSVNAPGDVLLDYLTNDRYGAGLDPAIIDTASIDRWNTYCNELVDYEFQPDRNNPATITQQHARYRIDGALNTYDTHKVNINKICDAGAGWFSYDTTSGLFSVIPDRAATDSEISDSLHFNGSNLYDQISITSTPLSQYYNAVLVEYPSGVQDDQTGTVFIQADPSIINDNEPTNVFTYRLDLVNHRARATELALILLNQARVDKVVEITTDHSGLQTQIGDIVRVSEPVYGWSEKLFRVQRISDVESSNGVLSVKLTLREYDADVYGGDPLTIEDLPRDLSGISNWWSQNLSLTPNILEVVAVEDAGANVANIIDPSDGTVSGTDLITNVRNRYGTINYDTSVLLIAVQVPPGGNYNNLKVTTRNLSAANVAPITQNFSSEGSNQFQDSEVVVVPINGNSLNNSDDYQFRFKLENIQSGAVSQVRLLPSNGVNGININTAFNLPPGSVGTDELADGAVTRAKVDPSLDALFTQLDQDLANAQIELDTLNNVTLPQLEDDLANANIALAENANAISTLNTVTLPQLESDLSDNANAINILNTVTLPAVNSSIQQNTQAISGPGGLNDQIVSLENELANVSVAGRDFIANPILTTEISNSAITTPKLAANQINANAVLVPGSITANEIKAGEITTLQLNSVDITTNLIQTADLNAGRITSGTLSTLRLNANEITTNIVQTADLNAGRITSGTLNTARLNANEITTNIVQTADLNAGRITSGTLSTLRLNASDLRARWLQAGKITASDIVTNQAVITGQAQMGSATINNAAIRDLAVSTLKIGPDAVMVPRYAVGSWPSARTFGTGNSGQQLCITPASQLNVGNTNTAVRLLIIAHAGVYPTDTTKKTVELVIETKSSSSAPWIEHTNVGQTIAGDGQSITVTGSFNVSSGWNGQMRTVLRVSSVGPGAGGTKRATARGGLIVMAAKR